MPTAITAKELLLDNPRSVYTAARTFKAHSIVNYAAQIDRLFSCTRDMNFACLDGVEQEQQVHAQESKSIQRAMQLYRDRQKLEHITLTLLRYGFKEYMKQKGIGEGELKVTLLISYDAEVIVGLRTFNCC
jgi:hypothetical protein